MKNIHYDIGINQDTGNFVMRFSNDGINYVYLEMDNIQDILGFRENLDIGISQFLHKRDAKSDR